METNVTFATLTPTQWLHFCQHAGSLSPWSSLRIALVGGEPFPPILVDEFFRNKPPNARLLNGYGATETTMCHTLYECKPSDGTLKRIPIGKAFDPTTQLYILDPHLRPVPHGFPGELFTGGPYVSKGYLNVSSASFVPESLLLLSGASDRMVYRTGDLVRALADGNLEHLGRIAGDRQVKLRGMRIDLSDVEATMWNISREVAPNVLQVAAVLHDNKQDGSKGQHLVVYFTARTGDGDGDGDRTTSDISKILKRTVAERLPVAMAPSHCERLEAIPMTSASKVDYGMLASRTPVIIQERTVNGTNTKLTDIQTAIAEVWHNAVGGIDGELTPSSGFFDVGGNSLALVQVQAAVQQFLGVKVGLSAMFASPTLEGIEALVEHEKAKVNREKKAQKPTSCANGVDGNEQWKANDVSKETNRGANGSAGAAGSPRIALKSGEVVDWAAEAILPPDFPRRADLALPDIRTNEGGGILLVGAAGMAGAHLLAHLLETTASSIYCIAIPEDNNEAAKRRVIGELRRWGLLPDKKSTSTVQDRIKAFAGFLTDPTLGLPASAVAQLDAAVHTIYHTDSAVSLLKKYSDLRTANLGSTLFLARLAAGSTPLRTKVLNCISTWGVIHLQTFRDTVLCDSEASWRAGPQELDNLLPGPSPNLGYLKCRWACEQILLRASETAGIPVNIIRTSMVSGSTRTGRPLEKIDINRRILAASLLVGGVPDFRSEDGGGMSWLPIDYLVRATAVLGSGSAERGVSKIWHIRSQRHILYRDMADALRPLAGYWGQMEVLQPEEWLKRIAGQGSPDAAVFSETLGAMYENGWTPFELGEDREAEAKLSAAGLNPPVVDAEMLGRLVVGAGGLKF